MFLLGAEILVKLKWDSFGAQNSFSIWVCCHDPDHLSLAALGYVVSGRLLGKCAALLSPPFEQSCFPRAPFPEGLQILMVL